MHPLISSFTDKRHDFLCHRTFAWPKPAHIPLKDALIHFHALLQVESRVERIVEVLFGHDRLRVADQSQVRVVDQGQYRMGVWSGGDFQNARILQVLVSWQNAFNQLQNAIKQSNLVFFCEIPAFINQGFEGLLCQVIRVDPCQVEPDLQIAKILFGEVFNGCSNCGFACSAT